MRNHASAMRRAGAQVRSGVARRLADLERRTPEWRAWLALLGEIDAALEAGKIRVTIDEAPAAPGAAPGAPLLNGRTVRVDDRALRRLLARLLATASRRAPLHAPAASLERFRPDRDRALRLIEATICHDGATISAAADAQGVEAAALTTVVGLAALPVLATCAATLSSRVPAHWSCGYCPVCGSWPLAAELRGVERERVLRCGRCGAGWCATPLRCAFCGESRHEQLGALATAEGLESRKAETCASCRSYLKSLAALTAHGLVELWLTDLETVELDVAARERGYGRPSASGHRIRCRLLPE